MQNKLGPPNLRAFICSHVFRRERPILFVMRDRDWQFSCGLYDHSDDEKGHVVGIGHLVENDPTLNELAKFKPDFEAERSALDQPWIHKKI